MSKVRKQRADRKWCQALRPQGPPPSDPFLQVRFYLLKASLPSRTALPIGEQAFIQMSLGLGGAGVAFNIKTTTPPQTFWADFLWIINQFWMIIRLSGVDVTLPTLKMYTVLMNCYNRMLSLQVWDLVNTNTNLSLRRRWTMKSSFWICQAENQAEAQPPAILSIILSHRSQQVRSVLKLGFLSAVYRTVILSFSGVQTCDLKNSQLWAPLSRLIREQEEKMYP